MMVSDQAWNCPVSAAGTPSISQITTRGRRASTRRAVNALATSLRSLVCSGGSILLVLSLPEAPGTAAYPGSIARMIFFRGPGREFSERDRALLALLRPHLHQAYLNAERRRCGEPRLTSRQRELLRLVAVGHTNGQIARRLVISEGTVRVHLQNIYERLQVSSRTAAVTRAFPDRAAV
jgi:DNA-binding CsgD family transcriptional regulator